MSTWTFDGYWNVVLGANRSASDVAMDFDLSGGDRSQVDEWLGQAEAEAIHVGSLDLDEMLAQWGEFHQRALDVLCDAI